MKKENMKIGRSIDFERETRVLLEDIQSSVKVMAEGHSGVISRLDRVEYRLGSVESELHTVKMVVFDLDTRLTKVETRLSGVETRLSGVETRLSGVDGKLDISIGQNEERFRHIEKKLALA